MPEIPPVLTVDDSLDMMVASLKEQGYSLPRPVLRVLYLALFEFVIRETIRRGFVRLPGGWGSLELRITNTRATQKLTPDGELVPVGPRPSIRFREGLALRALLGKLSPSEYKRRTPRPSNLPEEVVGRE